MGRSVGLLRGQLSRLLVDIAPLRESQPFRMLFFARTASLLVYGVLGVAVSLQVFALTQSSFHVGAVGFAAAGGTALGLLFGSPMADRYDRKPQMVWSRLAFLCTVLALLANALLAEPRLWLVYLAAGLGGLAGGFSAPALMAAAPTLIAREHLAAAGALTAIGIETGAIIGPPVAGLLIAGPGFAFCYAFVAIGAAITPVLLARLPPLPPKSADDAGLCGPHLLDALVFFRTHPVVAGLLATDFLTCLFIVPHVLIPQLAFDIFAGGTAYASLLYTAPAVGGLLAALTSGWTRHVRQPGRVLLLLTACWGLCVAVTATAPDIGSAAALFGLMGFFGAAGEILRGALLQCHVPDRLRGRVFGLWLLQSSAAPAIGGFQTGAASRAFSVPTVLAVGGAASMVATMAVRVAFPSLLSAKIEKIAQLPSLAESAAHQP